MKPMTDYQKELRNKGLCIYCGQLNENIYIDDFTGKVLGPVECDDCASIANNCLYRGEFPEADPYMNKQLEQAVERTVNCKVV